MTDRLQQTSGLELPLEGVILSRYLDSAERKQLLRRHSRDEVIQLHRGAYVESALWRYLSDGARHRAKALAVALHFGGDPVFCHLSAAAFWRLHKWAHGPPLRTSQAPRALPLEPPHSFGMDSAFRRLSKQ